MQLNLKSFHSDYLYLSIYLHVGRFASTDKHTKPNRLERPKDER